MRIYSKKDRWLSILIWITVIVPIIAIIASYIEGEIGMTELIIFSIIFILSDIFLLWCWYATYYIFEDDTLISRSGPTKKTIELSSIKTIQKTSNPLAGKALSLKRIEIVYGLYKIAMISPKNRDQFIAILIDKCPDAELKPEVGFLKDRS